MASKLVDLLLKVASLKSTREKLKIEISNARKAEEELLKEVRDLLDEDGLESVKFIGPAGNSMIAHRHSFTRARVTDREEFQKWCGESGKSEDDFRMFSAQKLSSYVREVLEGDGSERSVPKGCDVYEGQEVRIRKV